MLQPVFLIYTLYLWFIHPQTLRIGKAFDPRSPQSLNYHLPDLSGLDNFKIWEKKVQTCFLWKDQNQIFLFPPHTSEKIRETFISDFPPWFFRYCGQFKFIFPEGLPTWKKVQEFNESDRTQKLTNVIFSSLNSLNKS